MHVFIFVETENKIYNGYLTIINLKKMFISKKKYIFRKKKFSAA
jgi:hypothetical protein